MFSGKTLLDLALPFGHIVRMKFALLCLLAAPALSLAAETVYLDTLDLTKMRQGWGAPQTNLSMRATPLTIGGEKFARGVGTHAASFLWVELGGGSDKFTAKVGLDDAANGPGSVVFRVTVDGRRAFDSGLLKPGAKPKAVEIDLKGRERMLLQVLDGGDGGTYDHADWADAQFAVSGAAPKTMTIPREESVVLTPKPGPAPRLNGPTVYGARPGNPFIYRIPAQGQRPMRFAAKGLPSTLKLDAASGIITGVTPAQGDYQVTLKAENSHGKDSRMLRIRAGATLALTPPMGWNHWYAHYTRITDAMMREAADIMISSGMADAGYQYVNIDDCWMNAPKAVDPKRVGPARDGQGRILPNIYFPDMKGLADYIHGKGLKAGIYTSPGPLTCGGFTGAFGYEELDARTFAEWGFDFLKYDWCSYGRVANGQVPSTNIPTWGAGANRELAVYTYPYKVMGDLLQRQRRDIVYNLCQYGMGNVWEWGEEVGAQCWRTAGDLGFELDRIFEVALKNAEHRAWSRPGAWNDPDYIQIGYIGDAHGMGEPEPCPLTPNEQYCFMSLWALMASPLFYSGDMTRLDEFTLNVLCNPEVIEVNQDPLWPVGRRFAGDRRDVRHGQRSRGWLQSGRVVQPQRVSRASRRRLAGHRHSRAALRP